MPSQGLYRGTVYNRLITVCKWFAKSGKRKETINGISRLKTVNEQNGWRYKKNRDILIPVTDLIKHREKMIGLRLHICPRSFLFLPCFRPERQMNFLLAYDSSQAVQSLRLHPLHQRLLLFLPMCGSWSRQGTSR